MSVEQRPERGTLSLTEGGPFYRLLTRLHLRTPTSMARCWWVALIAWAPLAISAGIHYLRGEPIDPMLHDLSLHARLLLALPVLFWSELILEQTARSAMTSFDNGRFCDRAATDQIVERAEELRDSWVVEAALLGIALTGGQLVLWGVFGTTGLFHGGEGEGFLSFSRVWYTMLALPFVQFLLFRWVWRWLIWWYVLARISRLPLSALATHADFAAGLGPLARPTTGFSGFVLANSVILSAAWGTKLLEQRTTLEALLPMIATFLVIALLVAIGPLLSLSGQLFRVRRRTLAQYGDFVRTYTLQFHQRWIEAPPSERAEPLGSSDIQSLADIGNAFQVISKTRVFAFGPRNIFTVWFAGLLPMLPLLVSTLTVQTVLQQIIRTVLGGLPI